MTVTAPRRILIFYAAGLIALGLVVQYALGFRFGPVAAQATEAFAMVAYACGIFLLAAPIGRTRALMAGALGFILMAWAVHLNAHLSARLETLFGGQVVAAHRVLLATVFVGPILGLIVGVITGLLARSERIRWTPKTPAS
jgi:hypothetical protein